MQLSALTLDPASAGFRICLGTSVVVMLSATFSGPEADPTRMLGQVLRGIGLLGADVILTREGE